MHALARSIDSLDSWYMPNVCIWLCTLLSMVIFQLQSMWLDTLLSLEINFTHLGLPLVYIRFGRKLYAWCVFYHHLGLPSLHHRFNAIVHCWFLVVWTKLPDRISSVTLVSINPSWHLFCQEFSARMSKSQLVEFMGSRIPVNSAGFLPAGFGTDTIAFPIHILLVWCWSFMISSWS